MNEVIVVGAGPTGLLLAGDLAEAGVSVTLLEKRSGDVSNLSRAFGLHARTMEMLDARGLADSLLDAELAKVTDARLFERVHANFGRLPSRFAYLLITPQFNVENILLERATKAGVEIRYEHDVRRVEQDDAEVVVHATGPDGTPTDHRARYVVGADGVKSAVREALGLPYPGKSVLKSIMLADVRLSNEPKAALTVNGSGDEFAFIAPFGDGYWRVFCWDRRKDVSDDTPLDLDEVRAVTARALGTDHGMHDARWLSRFHSDERQVPQYRVGRVFLAGDAAHCHSPAGGLGMNTGMQDAANLSWKLVSALNGAPGELLDTYQSERHPVGKDVLRLSGTIIRLAMLKSRVARALRATVAGTVVRIPAVQRQLIGRLSAIGVRYRPERGAHRLIGTRAPDITLDDGTRLYEALRGGRFVLLSPTGDDNAAQLNGYEDRVVAATSANHPESSLLIRPDGYVGVVIDDPAGDGLRSALRSHCGAPAEAAA